MEIHKKYREWNSKCPPHKHVQTHVLSLAVRFNLKIRLIIYFIYWSFFRTFFAQKVRGRWRSSINWLLLLRNYHTKMLQLASTLNENSAPIVRNRFYCLKMVTSKKRRRKESMVRYSMIQRSDRISSDEELRQKLSKRQLFDDFCEPNNSRLPTVGWYMMNDPVEWCRYQYQGCGSWLERQREAQLEVINKNIMRNVARSFSFCTLIYLHVSLESKVFQSKCCCRCCCELA